MLQVGLNEIHHSNHILKCTKVTRFSIVSSFFHLVTDLALLSLADHSILTYGTYGMWGALLAKGGETLMSKEFMKTDIGSQIAAANLTNWKTIE